MKKLNIEEKAKAYDEALEKAKNYHSPETACNVRIAMENLFPELKESEDERIRKDIIWCLKHSGVKESNPINPHVTTIAKDAISWLEKQGEQKLIDKIQLGKKYRCIASPRYSTFMTGETYKPEDKFLCSLMNFCSDCFEPVEDGEQKPAEWINELEEKLSNATPDQLREWKEKYFKDEPVEWSDEDEKMLNSAIDACKYIVDNFENSTKQYEDAIAWLKNRLKFLRPQKQWKPSEKQMDALKEACDEHWEPDGLDPLYTLYQDLKKLMEG